MKFKVGDEVRVVKDDSGLYPETVGKVGVIDGIHGRDGIFPYDVTLNEIAGDSLWVPCNDNELELVTEEPTPTVGIIEELLTLLEVQEGDATTEIDESIFRATVWIERRHGSTSALAYLKEALKDG